LTTQERLISVDIAGTRARIAAGEKLLPSSRLRGPKAIEQVESIKITAEIDLVDLAAREETIAKIIAEGTEYKRLIGHARMNSSYNSRESELIRRAIAAIKELDAKRKLNMPVSVNNNTIQI
jgi:hypothetical protein